MDFEKLLQQASAQELANAGIAVMGGRPAFRSDTARLANDAALIGQASVGIPDFLALYIDPQSIKALFTPMRGEQTFGAFQYGNWTTKQYQGRFEEPTGNYGAYGDFSENGTTGANYNWFYRQSFEAQTFVEFGDRDVESYALANIDRVGDLKYAAFLTLEKFRNASYYYGVDGLQTYGLFNDPNLNPTISPNTKAGGGTTWTNATNIEIYNDFLKLFEDAQNHAGGNIEITDKVKVTLSPVRYTRLLATDAYVGSKSALELIKGAFTNLEIVQAPELSTDAGEQLTMVFDSVDGRPVCAAGFTEKLRSHRLIPASSSYKQKISAGTWGLIVKQPVGLASMLGI
ncbi:uncharacterized protein DUF2184 [Orbus hercynius]|uniref:Uncharacterized protein DUF2184 n=1 Tax=Orbus hercynius TaxID=593135 RepID=A0A495RIS0_9GAMM|nr:major capsid family protein [Orbus hercynius]RKS87325.1 uncharacterized protein DUF2184 [Orbus hercynius]